MEPATVEGACLCRAVRFEIDLPTLLCAHCHCTICRRAHGAAFVTWVLVPREQLRVLAGEDRLVAYRSSDHGTRSFCRTCGSALFFRSTHRPEQVDIVLANLEGPVDRAPQFHVFWDDRANWVRVADGLPRLGGVSGMEPLPAE